MNQQILDNAKILWDYLTINDNLKQSDCIIVFGSNDIRSAERGVELYQQKFAPKIIFAGGFGRMTRSDWRSSEAEVFAQRAVEMGVSEDHIYIESKSTNTAENIKFTQDLIYMHNLMCDSKIIVSKPYLTKRIQAIVQKQSEWKGVQYTSPQIRFEDYPNQDISMEEMIDFMVGEIDRLLNYHTKGYIDPQNVPQSVVDAYNYLKNVGYTHSLIA